MADFLRKWLLGVVAGWSGVGFLSYYILSTKLPLPSTEKYVQKKWERRVTELEKLQTTEQELERNMGERNKMKQVWRQHRELVENILLQERHQEEPTNFLGSDTK